MADDHDVLLTLFKHYADLGLYHQGQATSTTNTVLTLAGVLIGLTTFDQRIEGADILAAYALIGLGFFGLIWSAKQHERYDYFTAKAEAYRVQLAALMPKLDLSAVETAAELNASKRAKLLRRLRVRHLWMGVHLIVIAIGFLMAILYFKLSMP